MAKTPSRVRPSRAKAPPPEAIQPSAPAEDASAPPQAPPQPFPQVGPEQANAIASDIRGLSHEIIRSAETLQSSVTNSQVRQSLEGIRAATAIFQQMANNAATQAQRQNDEIMQMASTQRVNQLSTPIYDQPGVGVRAPGCCEGCGDECKPSCCILLYINRIQVIEGQRGADRKQLELIIAVQAGDTWGLLPGLTGNVGANVDGGWVQVYAPIAKFCVPCNECLTVPLTYQAMEVETMALGGRPEFGSSMGAISLRCDCPIVPQSRPVKLDGGGVGGGTVEIEVAAKRIGEKCCG